MEVQPIGSLSTGLEGLRLSQVRVLGVEAVRRDAAHRVVAEPSRQGHFSQNPIRELIVSSVPALSVRECRSPVLLKSVQQDEYVPVSSTVEIDSDNEFTVAEGVAFRHPGS